MQGERAFAIFCNGLPLKAVGFFQGLAAQNGSRTAEEGGIPLVQPALNDGIEHLVFRWHLPERIEVLFQRVRVQEEVRRLHQKQPVVGREMPNGFIQELTNRCVVCVEYHHQITIRDLQTSIQIASLCMAVLGAGVIANIKSRTERFQLLPTPTGRVSDNRIAMIAFGIRATVIK